MNTKSNNIRLAIDWINNELSIDNKSVSINNCILINDLHYFLKAQLELLQSDFDISVKSAYRRIKKLKDYFNEINR
jgi:hypothetical protein